MEGSALQHPGLGIGMDGIMRELAGIPGQDFPRCPGAPFLAVRRVYRCRLQGVAGHGLVPEHQPGSPVRLTLQHTAVGAAELDGILLHRVKQQLGMMLGAHILMPPAAGLQRQPDFPEERLPAPFGLSLRPASPLRQLRLQLISCLAGPAPCCGFVSDGFHRMNNPPLISMVSPVR
ncbi:hypothetical protein D3C75_882760 [compost metagenome]